MVPAAFWQYATAIVKQKYKHIVFVGEVYNPAQYRNYIAAGFDWLYDKVGMYDTMRAVICHHAPASAITGAWQQTDDIRDHMLYFLENHDEQRIASDFFAADAMKGVPAMITSLLMQQNPFMLYAGEEYGEHGMDKEGFSGNDGRTTIFDYWSIDTLCRAADKKLTAKEKQIFDIHKRAMQIASKEKAVSEGVLFDLMYVNPQLERQYVFLRKAGKEVLLVAVNFDDYAVAIDVKIPAHAFDYLEFEEGTYLVTDLLTKEKEYTAIKRDGAIRLTMDARGAYVLKFRV